MSAVPNLTTALTGPLQEIEAHFLSNQTEIEHWFRSQWMETQAPFYGSVDLRNAGFKLAPVDTNLFPAGFNNLNPAFMPLCVLAVQAAIEHLCPKAKRLIIIPESHTRNLFYLESLAAIREIIEKAGLQVRIGHIDPEADDRTVELPSGRTMLQEKLERRDNHLVIKDFESCIVLLNNDLSDDRPAILDGIDPDQAIAPPPAMGWSNRLKSDHFAHYKRVAAEFSEMVEIDPWLIDPHFRRCGKIDFKAREGEDCLADNVNDVLDFIRGKYREYGIDEEPFVIAKADSGTYGMNIMTVRDAAQIRELNRKQRNKMARGKGGSTVTDVLVQEGVFTFETWGDQNAIAEPVIYMIDHSVVGGFYRVHTKRGVNENLNAPGMHFEPLAFADSCTLPDQAAAPDAAPNRFYAYGVVARLALLAAAREIHSLTPA
ncbi:MAG TPA: glutamate--cysteine ligase [Gammaproteobacteria bacterium]|nr:glutamate--cysteine ligase [Gammaproteobacteria bacterium]